jgi:salicylate hydroxylase
LIFDLAVREGVTVKFNSLVVDADPQLGFVKLRTGERLYADVIIGADGYDSILRPFVTEFDDFKDQDMHLFLTFVIPADILRGDKDLRGLLDPRVVCLFTMSMIIFTNICRLVDLLVW